VEWFEKWNACCSGHWGFWKKYCGIVSKRATPKTVTSVQSIYCIPAKSPILGPYIQTQDWTHSECVYAQMPEEHKLGIIFQWSSLAVINFNPFLYVSKTNNFVFLYLSQRSELSLFIRS
jgi:hypothetical protein